LAAVGVPVGDVQPMVGRVGGVVGWDAEVDRPVGAGQPGGVGGVGGDVELLRVAGGGGQVERVDGGDEPPT
jgi:hypothetical protein